mmetsp:Transcript_30373/g.66524  ORF Transcript_30373/g.66524 Transcript_30373/m.66524 type:complete len:93 (-) Transcript_30373:1315-1593(-)
MKAEKKKSSVERALTWPRITDPTVRSGKVIHMAIKVCHTASPEPDSRTLGTSDMWQYAKKGHQTKMSSRMAGFACEARKSSPAGILRPSRET